MIRILTIPPEMKEVADLEVKSPWQMEDPPVVKRAKRMARKKNRDEWEIIMTVPGNPFYSAGMVGTANASFGKWAGNHLLTKVIHSWQPDSGYTTRVQSRKVLQGY